MIFDEHLKAELNARSAQAQAELDEIERERVHIALIGETGTGKSSLVNAIVGRKIAKTGGIGETTQQAQAIPHQEIDGLVFVDLPGCGTPNNPRETYIDNQGLLSKFDIFILVTDKRIREGDEWLYRKLRKENGREIFVVRTHFDQVVDEIPEAEARQLITDDIRKQLSAGPDLTPYIVALKGPDNYDLGKLIENIVNALSGWKQQKAILAVAALTTELLRKKREAAEKVVHRYALISAANGLNPIPGLDLSVDLAVLLVMVNRIITAYGLRDDQLNFAIPKEFATSAIAAIRQIAKPATEYLAKEAIIGLLKRFGTSEATKSVSKYVPFVGQAVAAYLGYQVTSYFGTQLVNDCERAAQEIARLLHERDKEWVSSL